MSKPQRICLIDDDIALCQAVALGLRDAGFEVIETVGAAAALDVLRRGTHGPVDAIVTDLNMPGTSGAQLISEVRKNWPSMPIIAISGSGVIDGLDIEARARALGADGAMQKPFRAKQLVELLEHVLPARAATI